MKKSVDRSRIFDNRPITFEEEIKFHLQLWKSDKGFKHLHKYVRDAVGFLDDAIQMVESVRVSSSMLPHSEMKKLDRSSIERKRFIAYYKQKFLECTDLECKEEINSTTMALVIITVDQLIKEGSGAIEYLNWVFDEFLADEKNKTFMPPTMKLLFSNFLKTKYLFINKDKFRTRKEDYLDSKKKLALIKIAGEMFTATKDTSVVDWMQKLTDHRTTYGKARDFFKIAAKNANLDCIIKQIDSCDKMEIDPDELRQIDEPSEQN